MCHAVLQNKELINSVLSAHEMCNPDDYELDLSFFQNFLR